MQDFVGRELKLGDIIASTDGGYSGLVQMVVIGFTPKMVKCERADGKNPLFAASGRSGVRGAGKPIYKNSCDIVFIRQGEASHS